MEAIVKTSMKVINKASGAVDSSNEQFIGFVNHLGKSITIENVKAVLSSANSSGGEYQSIRSIWKSCDLSADEFADQVATYYKHPRMTLPELMIAPPLVVRFSRRFLRETMMFPFDGGEGRFGLAVADPTDISAQRGAQIVLGGPIMVSVASFEDIDAVLSARLGPEEEGQAAVSLSQSSGAAEESVDSSARPRQRRASRQRGQRSFGKGDRSSRERHSHRTDAQRVSIVRMRVDGLLRHVPAPAHALPPALISRIKILAGLNIAERRLPQDGAARLEVASLDIDIRVATMPTQHGESAVIRLLAARSRPT